jgi:Domain of unknown function (DUF4965)/Domain of unknown function (DUF1793)/Domain of unknown function (DUF5127)/Domain of unknown function (DUF4964)
MKKSALIIFCSISLLLIAVVSHGEERPPAVPLITHNPYFSIWSMADHLTDQQTKHWTEAYQPLVGIIRVDGKSYRYMGANPRGLEAAQQLSVKVEATHSYYTFEVGGAHLDLSFFTPVFAQDLDLLSRPVTYIRWNLRCVDGKTHDVEILLDIDGVVSTNTDNQLVTWGKTQAKGLTVLNIGSRDQYVLNRSGDDLRIDWGYLHLAVPETHQFSSALSNTNITRFVSTGDLSNEDDLDMPKTPRGKAAHLGAAFHVKLMPEKTESRHVLIAYTENYMIEYLGRKLKPYWQRNNISTQAMLAQAEADYSALEVRGEEYDKTLSRDLEKIGGSGYRQLSILAYRQTLAAHGLAADLNGNPLSFPKENNSNGCISTVDVIYPSAPFYLFFNPSLLEAEVRPVLEYASLPRWSFKFAPHDLGTYPLANGQVYGGGENTELDQMPVEESGNLLILGAALGQTQNNWHVAKEFWPQFSTWAKYVREKGLDPENQLCTDDFAGHLAHNANLSLKAIEALGAYALMARGLGYDSIADDYMAAAKQMAKAWEGLGFDKDHYALAFDRPGTWSQKYNLVWDKILGLNLFSDSIRKTEVKYYLGQINKYGLPLDSRKDYTKLDWSIWTATLADNPDDFMKLTNPITAWLNESISRVPLTDWYDTKTGKMVGFKARSVVGGVYIKALSDPSLADMWRKK